ncbi:MAG TPA: MarC family protein [Gammaproteobacteria bacterium]|nr:MarC family protein [Gammaproteobacteria bacterium]
MMENAINAFILLFVVVDPVGVAPMFAAMTRNYPRAASRGTALRGVTVALVILVFFALGGHALLRYLGIGMPAFTIAGGILLFLLAVDMVLVRQTGLRTAIPSEQLEAEHRDDISVFPLAIPMIAGPGSLTTVLLLTGIHGWQSAQTWMVLGVVTVILFITLLMLLAAQHISRVLGETGVNVVARLFGIVLAALAVQYVSNGLHAITQP